MKMVCLSLEQKIKFLEIKQSENYELDYSLVTKEGNKK